ncbi:hypothetical protein BGZ46_001961 [Entomortierella lignicola]|nr:hypothetical protein BGZ46_001961 [Entomortierella lignicola]
MRSLRQQLAIIFGFATFSILVLTAYSQHNGSLYDHIQKHSPTLITSKFTSKKHTSFSSLNTSFPKSQWDPSLRYLVYLPFEGISNQFYSLQHGATLAKRLNRTLVVPPITSNRHDRLSTNQPWSHYMDLEHMSINSGIQLVEWHDIKQMNQASRKIIETGSRLDVPKAWKDNAEKLPCQVIAGYGHDHFVGEEDSIGADFAYQHMLDLEPIPVPGFTLDEPVRYIGDILDRNQNSTEQVICFTYTFTARFERMRNRWDIGWNEAGKYIRFLPRFLSYVEDVIAFRFGLLENHFHPYPPHDLGASILDRGASSESFLSRKPPHKEYIAIHLRRGDIEAKCVDQAMSDCVVPVSEYKKHVDIILGELPKDEEPPNVVLVSDTQSEEEKKEIDSYGWYRLDHALDPNLLDASKVLGPFSPAFVDSAVLAGRGARWVIGSRRSTMSWLAAMRLSSWYNLTIIYPDLPEKQVAEVSNEEKLLEKQKFTRSISPDAYLLPGVEKDGIAIWDRREQNYFERL